MISSFLAASLAIANSYAWPYSSAWPYPGQKSYLNISYSTVTGYLLQDVNSTNASTFDFVRKLIFIADHIELLINLDCCQLRFDQSDIPRSVMLFDPRSDAMATI